MSERGAPEVNVTWCCNDMQPEVIVDCDDPTVASVTCENCHADLVFLINRVPGLPHSDDWPLATPSGSGQEADRG